MSKWVGNAAHISGYLFNSASRQHHGVLDPQFPFLTMLITLYILVRLAFMITSTGLWYRLTNNLHLDCSSIQPLRGVPRPSQRLSSGLMYRHDLCWSLMVPPWQRSLTWILGLKVIWVAGSQLGYVYQFH